MVPSNKKSKTMLRVRNVPDIIICSNNEETIKVNEFDRRYLITKLNTQREEIISFDDIKKYKDSSTNEFVHLWPLDRGFITSRRFYGRARTRHLSIYLSIYLSINQSIYLSIHLSLYLSFYRCINLSIDRSIYVSLSIYLSIYLSMEANHATEIVHTLLYKQLQ
jgi:hypothetical protein